MTVRVRLTDWAAARHDNTGQRTARVPAPVVRCVAAAVFTTFIAVAGGCSMPTATEFTGHAIVMGVAQYVDTWSTINLTFTENDAREMADLLGSRGYAVTLLLNAEATRANLERAVNTVAATVAADTTAAHPPVVFFFSGHGGSFGGDEWIFPRGSVDSGGLSTASFDRAINTSELAQLLAAIPSRNRMIIIDACNSGGFVADSSQADSLPGSAAGVLMGGDSPPNPRAMAIELYFRLVDQPAPTSGSGSVFVPTLVMTGGGADEEVWETSAYRNGVFTYFLLQAATGGDLDGDGNVTFTEAYQYVFTQIQRQWNQEFVAAADTAFVPVQFPHISGSAFDAVLFPAMW